MTTEVKIRPAGHNIKVTLTEGESQETVRLDAGTDERSFWIYGGKKLTVEETNEPPAAE
jgi:hypothetical protein